MSYKHLSLKERYCIQLHCNLGTSQNEIAKILNRSQSTISREVERNTGKRGYRYQQANRLALQRHHEKKKFIKLTETIKQHIVEKIRDDFSKNKLLGGLTKRV